MADNGTEPEVYIFFQRNLDIPLGLLYCVLGTTGVVINGMAIATYWKIRRTLRMLPFLLCSICLAHNDTIMLACAIVPYGVILLAGRPAPPLGICRLIGFVHNFCERFAWLIITSIMVFRCVTMIFPVRTRNVSPNLFAAILGGIGSFIFVISALPFLPLEFVEKRYEYVRNLAECSYQITPNSTALITLIDVVWWAPFITCAASCAVFSIVIIMYSAKFKSIASKKNDAIKKTIILTLFFIICYLPKAALSSLYITVNKGLGITWDHLEKFGFTPFLYIQLLCNYLIPASRAAFTPLMLKLRSYIKMCNKNKKPSNKTKLVPKLSLSQINPQSINNGTHVKLLEDAKRISCEKLV